MPTYSILGLRFELPWSLDLPAVEEPADYQVTFGPVEDVPDDPAIDSPLMTRKGRALELSMGGICRMVVPGQGTPAQVECYPHREQSIEEVKRQVLEHLIPRLLSRHYQLVLHASCAVFEHNALGFFARSGSGKSTMALAMARAGATILGDDSLVLDRGPDGAMARALWSTVRAFNDSLSTTLEVERPDAESSKIVLTHGEAARLTFERGAHPLKALYALEESDEIRILPMSPREAMLALLREAYHLEFDDMKGMAELMARTEQLGLTRRTFRLAYPRDFARLPEVVARVRAHAASL
ncbi:MAG: hypothetical protein QM778_25400 [Myxococcales bacterium]